MKATVLYNAGASISVRLFDPSANQWYDGATWTSTEGSADLQALTEKTLADPYFSRYSKNITTWPAGDYLVEYVNTATDEVFAEEPFTTVSLVDGKVDIIDTNVDSILVDTGTDIPTSLTIIDGNVDAILEDTSTTLPAEHAVIAGYIDTEIGAMQGNVTDILADTNELQTNQGNWITADVSGLATTTHLNTVEGKVDTVITNIATVDGKIDTADAVVDAILVIAEILKDVALNKKTFTEETGVVYLNIFNDAGDTIIYKFPYKNSSGANLVLADIGKMAQQLASII